MTELVAPFRAWHYNKALVGSIDRVVTPPYDVIPPSDVPKYLTRSPYNLAHVLLPKHEGDTYEKSAATIARWKDKKIIQQDALPHYYLYSQEFVLEGKTWTRNTIFSAVQLHDFADGIIRPHENTHGKYKADRLLILRETKMNLSPIFAMVLDKEGVLQTMYEEAMYQPPAFDVKGDDGVAHRIWKLGESYFPRISAFFKDKPLYIVDGHHRYESALQYARETGEIGTGSNAARMMCCIANAYDPALAVFPTHRWLHEVEWAKISKDALEKEFTLRESNWDDIAAFVDKETETPTFGLYAWGKLYLVTRNVTRDELSVTLSDEGLLKDVLGIQDNERSARIHYERALAPIREGVKDTELVVFHARPSVLDIVKVADKKGFMPQKSTYFYPKLISGVLMKSSD